MGVEDRLGPHPLGHLHPRSPLTRRRFPFPGDVLERRRLVRVEKLGESCILTEGLSGKSGLKMKAIERRKVVMTESDLESRLLPPSSPYRPKSCCAMQSPLPAPASDEDLSVWACFARKRSIEMTRRGILSMGSFAILMPFARDSQSIFQRTKLRNGWILRAEDR
jgi:hypothetical protein